MNFPQRIGTKITAGLLAGVTLMTSAIAAPAASSLRLPTTSEADSSIIAIPDLTQLDVSGIIDDSLFQINFQNTMCFISGVPAEVEPFATAEEPAYGKILEGPLNVRIEASSSSDRVKQLPVGYVVDIIGEQDGWYQLADGYIASSYVEILEDSQVEAARAEYEAAVKAAEEKAKA